MAKSKSKGVICPWCPFNKGQAGSECSGKDCDFKTLPYEKEAILSRIKEERARIKELTKNVDDEELIATAIDATQGIKIMISRLQVDFNMSANDIKKELGAENIGIGQKMKLMAALARMKKNRGK